MKTARILSLCAALAAGAVSAAEPAAVSATNAPAPRVVA